MKLESRSKNYLILLLIFQQINKHKLLETIKNRRKKSDFLLKEWLSTPIVTDKTDAVHDHDLVL